MHGDVELMLIECGSVFVMLLVDAREKGHVAILGSPKPACDTALCLYVRPCFLALPVADVHHQDSGGLHWGLWLVPPSFQRGSCYQNGSGYY